MAFFFEIADVPVVPSPTIASGANAASNPLDLGLSGLLYQLELPSMTGHNNER